MKTGRADISNGLGKLPPGTKGMFRFTADGEKRELAFGPLEKGESTADAVWREMDKVAE